MPLILDTNVVRELGSGNLDVNNLISFRNEGGSIHLADGTAVELFEAIYSGRFDWAHWVRAKAQLRKIIDRDRPIMPGGRELLTTIGIIDDRNLMAPQDVQHILRECWAHVMKAKRVKDIKQLVMSALLEKGLHKVELNLGDGSRVIQANKSDWIESFERLGQASKSDGDSVRKVLARRGTDIHIGQENAKFVGQQLDSMVNTSFPRLSVRLDAMIRAHSLHTIRSLKPREPYNPSKNVNDAFDLDLLLYLAVPAAVCTNDRRIHTVLKDTNSWQRFWVVRFDELSSTKNRQDLITIKWPAIFPS